MDEHTDRSSTDHARADRKPGRTTERVLRRIRGNGTQFGERHDKTVAIIRSLVAIWLVILGSIFCVLGHYWGALLFVPAGLNGWLAYQMPRLPLTLNADADGRLHG
jgi:hypothetical protein